MNWSGIFPISDSDYSERTQPRSIYNYNISLFGRCFINERWSARAKLGYENKGFANRTRVIFTDDRTDTNTKYRLGYITLPITFDRCFGKKRLNYLGMGPYFAALISAKDNFPDSSGSYDAFKKIDLGLGINLGTQKRLSDSFSILVEGGYSLGMTKINNASGPMVIGVGESFRNSVFYLNLGFAIDGTR